MNINTNILFERIRAKILQVIPKNISLLINTKQLDLDSDIDLFIILDNPPKNDPYNIKSYIKVVEAIKTVEKEIWEETEFHIIDFSTIRIEEYHCKKAVFINEEKKFNLHLLIYPTVDHFLTWENPSVILSICKYHNLLYGDKDTLQNLIKRIKINSFEERIQPLISLLFETYRNIIYYVEVPKELDGILMSEGINKLKYILKFLIWEILIEKSETIPPPAINSIIQLAKINKIDETLIKLLEKTIIIKKQKVSISDLKLLYEECMFKVNKIVNI